MNTIVISLINHSYYYRIISLSKACCDPADGPNPFGRVAVDAGVGGVQKNRCTFWK